MCLYPTYFKYLLIMGGNVMMRKIDFMIIGAQKAGSSSLHYYLSQHPDIFMPKLKDIQFFERDEYYNRLEDVIGAIYKDVKDEKIIGGSDVNLLYFYYTADRLYEYNPNIKLIAILRNPIDRAYSAYWAARLRGGFETCKSFEEALEKENERRRGTLRERGILTYLEHGHYDEQLEYYFKVFGKEKVYVLLTEDLRNNPQETVKNLLLWLGVTPDISYIDFRKKYNVSAISKALWMQRFFISEGIHTMIYRKLPPDLRLFIYDNIYLRFRKLNSKPFKYPPMNPETRERLIEYFRPHIERLSEMIGRDLSHWLN